MTHGEHSRSDHGEHVYCTSCGEEISRRRARCPACEAIQPQNDGDDRNDSETSQARSGSEQTRGGADRQVEPKASRDAGAGGDTRGDRSRSSGEPTGQDSSAVHAGTEPAAQSPPRSHSGSNHNQAVANQNSPQSVPNQSRSQPAANQNRTNTAGQENVGGGGSGMSAARQRELQNIARKDVTTVMVVSFLITPIGYLMIGKWALALLNFLTANYFFLGFLIVPFHTRSIIRNARNELDAAGVGW